MKIIKIDYKVNSVKYRETIDQLGWHHFQKYTKDGWITIYWEQFRKEVLLVTMGGSKYFDSTKKVSSKIEVHHES